MSNRADGTARNTDRTQRLGPRQKPWAILAVLALVVSGLAPIVMAGMPALASLASKAPANPLGGSTPTPIVGLPLAKAGGTPTVVTLGQEERQNISASNQFVNGNLHQWLEGQLYDTEVRFDAGTAADLIPTSSDFAMTFLQPSSNGIAVDWTQDWAITLDKTVMYFTQSSGTPFLCRTPGNITGIPLNGQTIQMPLSGSACIKDVNANTTGNPTTGWLNLMKLPAAQLNAALPHRNDACPTVSSRTGLCAPAAEPQSSPAGEHFFEVNFSAIFGPSGIAPQSWWPNLPAGMSIGLYWRNHLALTSIWDVAAGGSGGGSQPEFCINTTVGAMLNTVNRCGWTTITRLGASAISGSSNHGAVIAPGIGQKTIPLPQVLAPGGTLTVCKIVTGNATDLTGAQGTLTNGWNVTLSGGTLPVPQTRTTGSSSTGCAKFTMLFPASNYTVSEALKLNYVNIGVVVSPSADRVVGTNPNPANPVKVSISAAEGTTGTGPTVTFVNFLPSPSLLETCAFTIKNATGILQNRTYALVGDTVTHNFTVKNTGNVALLVTQTHTNTAVFGANPLFSGTLLPGQSHSTLRSVVVTAANLNALSDSCSSTGTATVGGTNLSANSSASCGVGFRAPHVSFEKHPVASDHVAVISGSCVHVTISVSNSGNATAYVNVSDALAAGQTLENQASSCGAAPSPTPGAPTAGAKVAPVTISWKNVVVAPNATVNFSFWVVITSKVGGAVITGNMTIVATNGNGGNYTPNPNTAEDVVTVLAPNVSFVKHPVAADNVTVISGGCYQVNITVRNTGNALAYVNVSDALGAGQTLENQSSSCGAAPTNGSSLTSPATAGAFAAPVTISWTHVLVGIGQSVSLKFWMLVTKKTTGPLTGSMTLTAENANGVSYTPAINTAQDYVTVLAPNVSFVKHPVAADNVTVISGGCYPVDINVSNTGNALAYVNVSDALGAGQTLENQSSSCGAAPTNGSSLTSPATSGAFAAPVTIAWTHVLVGVGKSVDLKFWVLVTKKTAGSLTGSMTLTAENANGVDYTPAVSTAQDLVTVLAPNVSFVKHPVASDQVNVTPGGCLEVTIQVSNTGNALAYVNVSDALDAGQTLENQSSTCGAAPTNGSSLTSPATAGAFAAPVTIAWTHVLVGIGKTVDLTFWVVVTKTAEGAHVTGNMTLTAANANGVNYTPSVNTAQDSVTVVRPILKLTEFGYTNSPNGTPTTGIVNGTTVYTVKFTNYGDNTSFLSGSLTISVTGGSGGSWTCWGATGPASLTGCVLTWTNVTLAPGASVTFTVAISYSHMPTGAVVDAALAATYVSVAGGTTFVPSGVPAKIEFTIQGA